MLLSPFMPLGQTFLLVANSTAPAGVQPTVNTGSGTSQFHVANMGSQVVYLSWGATATAAQVSAVMPTAGTPQSAIPLMPGTAAVYTLPVGSFISGITPAAGATNVMITLGEGA